MNKLKELRMLSKLSQAEIGKILSITSQAYGNYENGNRSIPFEQINKLAKYYGVSSDYLMGVADNPKQDLPINGTHVANKPSITDDFHVIISGPICDAAQKEILDFVVLIKAKYGYPKTYHGITGALERQKELSHK